MKSNLERLVWISDTHGDKADPGTLAVFREVVESFRPVHRIHGGDAFDFRWLRRAARDDEKRETIEADVEAGCDLLGWYRPTVALLGNHDDRLTRAIASDTGHLKFLCSQLWDRIQAASPSTRWLPYSARSFYRLGDTVFIHGVGHGMNAVREAARVYGNVVCGHGHGMEMVSVPRVGDRGVFSIGRMMGCGCDLRMDYAAAALGALRWVHGFGWGWVNTETGSVSIHQAYEEAGEWFNLPDARTYTTPSRERSARSPRATAGSR